MYKHHIVAGWDPAIKNFGLSIVEFREDLGAYRVKRCGMVQHPINDISGNLRAHMRDYNTEIRSILHAVKPKCIIVERFQNRGMVGAAMNEKVNIMIGLLVNEADHLRIDIRTITPAAWKNKVASKIDLKQVYNSGRKYIRDYCKENDVTDKEKIKFLVNQVPHCTDSTVMTLLVGAEYLELEDELHFVDVGVAHQVAKGIIQTVMARKVKLPKRKE